MSAAQIFGHIGVERPKHRTVVRRCWLAQICNVPELRVSKNFAGL